MQLRVVQLITHLSRGGAQATVLAAGPTTPAIRIQVLAGVHDSGEGTLWDAARSEGIDVREAPHLRQRLAPIHDVLFLIWLVRWLRRERVDVLHTHSSKAGVLGRIAASIAGVPAVHTVHGWSFAPFPSGWKRLVVISLERWLARRSKALVVVTSLDRDLGLAVGIGRADQYVLIRSGVDLAVSRLAGQHPEKARHALGVADGQFVVGAVARLAPQKRIEDLIDGFRLADLPDSHLHLIGDGPMRKEHEDHVRRVGLAGRVTFSGVRADAAELVSAFDVFCLTSGWEGLPRTLIEAMAAGRPVVATPVGGVAEVVDHGESGLITPVGDIESLACALRRLADDGELRARLGASGPDRVAGFDIVRMRKDLADLWFRVGRSRNSE